MTPSERAREAVSNLRKFVKEDHVLGTLVGGHLSGLVDDAERAIAAALTVPTGHVRDEHQVDRKVLGSMNLPMTKDGLLITPGAEAWCIRTARWKWIGESGTPSYRGVEDYTDYPEPKPVTVSHIGHHGSELQRLGVVRGNMSYSEMTLPEWLFSTREAAEAARGGGA